MSRSVLWGPPYQVLALSTLAVLIGCSPGAATRNGGSPAPAPSAPSAIATRVAPELALATFDSAWSRVRNTYYDTTFKGLDWIAVRDELRPRAAVAMNDRQLRSVIADMLGRLGDSHFAVIPREAADALDPEDLATRTAGAPSDIGVELRWVGEDLVVTRVEPGSPAEAAGIRHGWALDAIGDVRASDWITAMRRLEDEQQRRTLRFQLTAQANALLIGDPGSSLILRLRDAADSPVERRVVRRPVRGEPVRFGNLPTMFVNLEQRRIPLGNGCVGLIRFDVWMPAIAEPFGQAMREFAGCSGIVLDLRGNPGGVAGMVMGVSGYFLREVLPIGVMKTRQNELRLVSNPQLVGPGGARYEPFVGPLAILVDAMSASTSEIFAAGMQAHGRARVFGETSAGQALPALPVRLPNDDILYHAIADFTDPKGVRIEGRGAVPDEAHPLTRGALLAGEDPPLDAAVRWIAAAAGPPVVPR